MTDSLEALTNAARAARERAYAPYSRYCVGCAIETEDGRVFTGCNVENASYGLTMCAERVALGAAVAAGARTFRRAVLVTAGGKNIAPQPIQNALKLSRYIAEAVLIGDRRPYPIAVIVPNFASLEAWAREQGIPVSDRETMVAEPRVVALYEEEMQRRVASFARYEMPKKVLVLARELSLENGELTPTLKVRRRAVEDALKDRIEALYAEPRPAHA